MQTIKGSFYKTLIGIALAGAFIAGAFTGYSSWIGRAQAAPAAEAPSTPLAQLIAGKAGTPLSINADSIPPDFRLVGLIDAQGKSGYYVTRGETLTIGTDNYLVAYEVTIFNDEAGGQKIARGEPLLLSLINLHTVEIISHIGALPGVGTPPPPRRQEQE